MEITVNLDDSGVEALENLAEVLGVSPEEAAAKAIVDHVCDVYHHRLTVFCGKRVIDRYRSVLDKLAET